MTEEQNLISLFLTMQVLLDLVRTGLVDHIYIIFFWVEVEGTKKDKANERTGTDISRYRIIVRLSYFLKVRNIHHLFNKRRTKEFDLFFSPMTPQSMDFSRFTNVLDTFNVQRLVLTAFTVSSSCLLQYLSVI